MSPVRKPSDRGLRTAAVQPAKDVLQAPDKPAAATPGEKWPARISMTASREMKRALDSARLNDGVEVTRRIRAMIALWQEDPQLRTRIDVRAQDEDLR